MSRTDDVMLAVAEALDRRRDEIEAPKASGVTVSISFDDAGCPVVSIVVVGESGEAAGPRG